MNFGNKFLKEKKKMLKRSNKKGFTIVELVIVIAVVAILAAVLIPTFAGIINEANKSNDTVLVKNLNTFLVTDKSINGEGKDRIHVKNALAVAFENGYSIEKLTPTSENNLIVWDEENNQFALVDNKNLAPVADDVKLTSKKENIWIISEDYASDKAAYSQYLSKSADALPTAVQAGIAFADEIAGKDVNYKASGEAKVSFMLNGGNLTVDNTSATVYSYGNKSTVTVTAVAENSYHEYGNASYIEAAAGRIVVETGASVNALAATGNIKLDVQSGATLSQAVGVDDATITIGTNNGTKPVVAEEITSEEKEDFIASATMFAGGDGTKDNPYLIANREQFANIDAKYGTYYYYEITAKELDLSNWSSVKLMGSLEGNGVVITNLDNNLFMYTYGTAAQLCYVKNIDMTIDYISTAPYFDGAVTEYAIYTYFDNVDVHGSFEGGSISAYVGMGWSDKSASELTFKDCEADLMLVGTSSAPAGFIVHPWCDYDKSSITIIDSAYTGVVSSSTGTARVYYTNDIDAAFTINVEYSNNYINTYGSKLPTYVVDAGGNKSFTDAEYHGTQSNSFNYVNTTKLSLKEHPFNEEAIGKIFTVEAVAGASYAHASLYASPNGTNETGSYTRRLILEQDLELADNSFVTEEIKCFDITVNANGLSEGENSNGTYNIVGTGYGSTHNGAFVTIIQYNASGLIIQIDRFIVENAGN